MQHLPKSATVINLSSHYLSVSNFATIVEASDGLKGDTSRHLFKGGGAAILVLSESETLATEDVLFVRFCFKSIHWFRFWPNQAEVKLET